MVWTRPRRRFSNVSPDVAFGERGLPDARDFPPGKESPRVAASRPVTSVKLTLSSKPGCTFFISVDVLYDERQRVEQLVLGNPVPDCL